MSAEWGTPPFRDLQYCLRCCMPASNEGVSFDEFGVCKACQSSEQKMRIDWTLREKALRNILDKLQLHSRMEAVVLPIPLERVAKAGKTVPTPGGGLSVWRR